MIAATHPVQVEEVTKTNAYRLMVFNRAGTQVLLELGPSGYNLPLVDIPEFSRLAKEVTTVLRDRWSIPSVLLFSGLLEQNPVPVYFGALEAQVGTYPSAEGMNWFTVHHAISYLLKNNTQRALESSYVKFTNRIVGNDPEPFSRLGWLSQLKDWVTTVIGPLDMELKDFEQLNGCETFSLIRFETTQYPVWFKAVGEPNLHEFGISQALARRLPGYVPEIIATKPEWHGWLMADAGGAPLRELAAPSAWHTAVETLGKLQVESIGKVDELTDVGCRNLATANLLELVDPFLEVMADLMRQQTKSPPSIPSQQELYELGQTIQYALCCLATLEIPETIGHRDFNPGNIIIGPGSCTLIDWAEAYVGHPFLTFEYFLAHLRKDSPQFVSIETDLRASYSRMWKSVVSPTQVAEAYLFSPLVAVYAYAAGSSAWRDSERLKIPGFHGYLRSLTRRMKQEADLLQRRRVECLN